MAFWDDGDMLLRLTGAGASRLPKTLGIVLAEEGPAARDVEASARATGSSNLPVAALNVPSMLGSGAASFLECLRNRFSSARFMYRRCRGSLSLIRRARGAFVGLRVIDTLHVDLRFGGSMGRMGSLVEAVGADGPNEAVDGALLRADALGSARSASLGFAEDVDAVVLRADTGFCTDEAVLVTRLAAFTGAVVVLLPRALEGGGRAADLDVAGVG